MAEEGMKVQEGDMIVPGEDTTVLEENMIVPEDPHVKEEVLKDTADLDQFEFFIFNYEKIPPSFSLSQ
jgi:hypothetical protein